MTITLVTKKGKSQKDVPTTSKTTGKQKKLAATNINQAEQCIEGKCLRGECIEEVMAEAFSRASVVSFCDAGEFYHSHHPNFVGTTADFDEYLKRVRGIPATGAEEIPVGDVTRLQFDDSSTLHIVYPGVYYSIYGSAAGNEKAANALDKALVAVFEPLREYQKTLPENNPLAHAGCTIADLRARLFPAEFDLLPNYQPEESEEGRFECIGKVAVETGQLVIADPCRLGEEGQQIVDSDPNKPPDNLAVMDRIVSDSNPRHRTVLVPTGVGDGTYDVIAEYRDCGQWGERIMGISIDFTPTQETIAGSE